MATGGLRAANANGMAPAGDHERVAAATGADSGVSNRAERGMIDGGEVSGPAHARGIRWWREGIVWLSPFLLLVVIWSVVAWGVSAWRGVSFPTPWATAIRLLAMLLGRPLVDHTVYLHAAHSLLRWGIGFLIAVSVGLLTGLGCGWWRLLERMVMPCVHMLQLIPGLAWIPVALLIFGVGEKATIFMIAMTAFTPIAINVHGGVKRVDEVYVRAARMMGARGFDLFFHVLIPGALPHILSGLRVGLGNGWRVLVAGEMIVGAGTGLGYAIIQARWTLDYSAAFACVVIICMVGLVLERLVFVPFERRTIEQWGLRREGG